MFFFCKMHVIQIKQNSCVLEKGNKERNEMMTKKVMIIKKCWKPPSINIERKTGITSTIECECFYQGDNASVKLKK